MRVIFTIMADDSDGTNIGKDEQSKEKEVKISLTVKTPKEKEVIEVSEKATVAEVSEITHCSVYSGITLRRILV